MSAKQVTMVIQVNGKIRDRIEVPEDIEPQAAVKLVLNSSKVPLGKGSKGVSFVWNLPGVINVLLDTSVL